MNFNFKIAKNRKKWEKIGPKVPKYLWDFHNHEVRPLYSKGSSCIKMLVMGRTDGYYELPLLISSYLVVISSHCQLSSGFVLLVS